MESVNSLKAKWRTCDFKNKRLQKMIMQLTFLLLIENITMVDFPNLFPIQVLFYTAQLVSAKDFSLIKTCTTKVYYPSANVHKKTFHVTVANILFLLLIINFSFL